MKTTIDAMKQALAVIKASHSAFEAEVYQNLREAIADLERAQAKELAQRHEDTELLDFLESKCKNEVFTANGVNLRQHIRNEMQKSKI